MKLEFAFLADAATMLPDGNFDVIKGGFDVVTATNFPATRQVVVLIARLSIDAAESGKQYEFSGEIFDLQGRSIFPALQGKFTPAPHPRQVNRANWMTICLTCQGVVFPTPGDYVFRLSVNGLAVAEVMIEVVQEKPT
jgi:Family of unknown function (DUF6941)